MDIILLTWQNINWKFLNDLKDHEGIPFGDTFKRVPCEKKDPLALSYTVRTLIEGVSSDVIMDDSPYLALENCTFLLTDIRMSVLDDLFDANIEYVHKDKTVVFSIDLRRLLSYASIGTTYEHGKNPPVIWVQLLEHLVTNPSFDKWIKRTWRIL